MIKLIDKYILKEITGAFLFGVVAFSSISAGVGVLPNLIHLSTKYSFSFNTVIQLFFARLPEIIVFTFPTSILLASLISFNRLSSDSEITAFRACGVSFFRMVVPAVFMGVIVSFLTISFNEIIVPRANIQSEMIVRHAKQTKKPKLQESVSIPEYKNGILKRNIFAGSMSGNTLKNVNVVEYENGHFARTIVAEEAVYKDDGGWDFSHGVMHMFFKEDLLRVISVKFDKEQININYSPDQLLVNKKKKDSKNMNYVELRSYISQLEKAGVDTSSLGVQLYQKISIPFACLVFVLLGCPLGVRPTRGSSAMGLGMSLIIVIVYYILMAVGQWLGSYGAVTPLVAAWLPNLVVGSFGAKMLFKRAN